jgi:uncharacterized protein (TIGR03437 family)
LISAGAIAAAPGFLLGADYSEWLPPNVSHIGTDNSGAIYVLSGWNAACSVCVIKLSSDGRTILWQNQLGFQVSAMAVDPSGGVYVIPVSQSGDASIYVDKLSSNGTGFAWKAPVPGLPAGAGYPPVLAVDPQGRAYVAAPSDLTSNKAGVVRLNTVGSAVEYTAQVTGVPSALAVDPSGAAFVAGIGFLARLAPDGSASFHSTLLPVASPFALAADSNGDAVLYAGVTYLTSVLQRFDSTGAIVFTHNIFGGGGGLALDAAGNAYVTGFSAGAYSVRNSLAMCGSALLSVYARDGSLLQTTYIGGPADYLSFAVATAPDSAVLVAAMAGPSYAPTQAGPFAAATAGADFLMQLSPNSSAQTFPLACVANAASFGIAPVAPGEIVTLFGNGLGPEQGAQTSATLQNPYPTQAAGVEVTFDGTPAPLLWVQDSQINAVAPWSLTPGESTQVCVTYNSVKTNCLTWPVAQTAPGVFTVDGVYAAAVNQDGTINSVSHPAPVGSIVSVWATGIGPITPAQPDGTLVDLPLPTNAIAPVAVQAPTPIFEPCHQPYQTCPAPYIDFAVSYAGPAPYMVAGVSQVNFQVVDYAPSGYQTGAIFVDVLGVNSLGFQIHYVAAQ